MYEFHNNILSIPARLLYDEWKLMSYRSYLAYCENGKLVRTKAGKGLGNQAWVSFHDLPVVRGINLKEFCLRSLGKPEEQVVVNALEKYIVPDPKAIDFFALHRKPDGKALPFEKQREKATSAMILNAVETIVKDRLIGNRIFANKKVRIWQNISDAVNSLDPEKWKFNLPANPRSLKRRYNDYLKDRYAVFIHGGEGSVNARKVTSDIERLIIALYCLPHKPYASATHDMYLRFLGGGLEVYDVQTGELFERENFYDDAGRPVELSEATIWNYINKPENQVIIAKFRNGDYDFSQKVRPHVNRHAPQFSMSKISLDDRDILHTKLPDGSKVMAYYAFDVMSGAMIGIAHSRSKNAELFLDCIRNMFRFTSAYGLGVPMQVELEKHLTGVFADGLLKAGKLFPFVRICNPTNSQEKYAETGIRRKKYGVEKDRHQNVGRHYARLESNRVTQQKIFDAENDNYKFAKAGYEQIVADEMEEQRQFNNQLHPDQKRFKGKTRLQVFLENVNPDLPKLNKAMLARYVGDHTATTIRRSQYVTVRYGKYQLPTPQVLTMLAPNNYGVDAYYLPENGTVGEVYLFQNDVFLCQCQPAPVFNTARAEWTDWDENKYKEATAYIAQFDQMVKHATAEKLPRVGVIRQQPVFIEVEAETVPEPEKQAYQPDYSFENQYNRAINDL
ncbi:MAG: hypothetical protein Q4G08_10585 [Capnocytophaga sp.]|nr:hypothetical protein [Capnocytophaga sp.]